MESAVVESSHSHVFSCQRVTLPGGYERPEGQNFGHPASIKSKPQNHETVHCTFPNGIQRSPGPSPPCTASECWGNPLAAASVPQPRITKKKRSLLKANRSNDCQGRRFGAAQVMTKCFSCTLSCQAPDYRVWGKWATDRSPPPPPNTGPRITASL